MSYHHHLRFCFFLFLLIALTTHCNQPNNASLSGLQFNGVLTTRDGLSPSKAEGMEYIHFLKRKALLVNSETRLQYKLEHLSLDSGTLEFWIKPYPLPVPSPVELIRFTQGGRLLRISLHRNQVQALFQVNQAAVSAEQAELSKGVWTSVFVSWKTGILGDPKLLLSCNAKTLTRSSATQQISGDSPEGLRIQLLPPGNSDFEVGLRDLLWSEKFQQKFRFEPANSPSLVFRSLEFNHFAGKKVEDQQASGGFAWTTDSMMLRDGAVALPAAGSYELTYRIKPIERIRQNQVWSSVALQNGTPISMVQNSSETFVRLNSYALFSQRFRMPQKEIVAYELHTSLTEKHWFLVDTITIRHLESKWEYTRRAEDLEHGMGSWQLDPESSKGKAWTNGGPLTFGPYTCIGKPGMFRAIWRIKIAPDVPANKKIVALDVFAHDSFFPRGRRTRVYSRASYTSNDFPRGQWVNKSIDFRYDGADQMEFRTFAFVTDPGAVRVDTVTVEPIP